MKNFRIRRIVCFALALCTIIYLCIVPAFARSSPTLDAYRADCTAATGGRIDVNIYVAALGTMDKIGVEKIYLYESTDDVTFRLVKIFYASAWPAMMDSNTNCYYKMPVYYSGVVGRYYMATAYVYAELNGISDTKTYETASVRAIS